jgi:hypothetical protein
MKQYMGSILELKNNQAIIITDSCDFVTIHRKPDMFVGQQIEFKDSDIYNSNRKYTKYFALAASLFIIVVCSVLYYRISMTNAVFAYVDVDINPSIELFIDENSKVLDTKPLNSDAKTLLSNLELVNLPVKDAVSQVIQTSIRLGFISTERVNDVLVSASINEDSDSASVSEVTALYSILSGVRSISFNIGSDSLKPQILIVTPENRNSAVKNKLSMGRYVLYSKIKAENNDITVEKAKIERISDMLAKVKIEDSGKIESNGADTNSPSSGGNSTFKSHSTISGYSDYKNTEPKNKEAKKSDFFTGNPNTAKPEKNDSIKAGSKKPSSNSTKDKNDNNKKAPDNANSNNIAPGNNNSQNNNSQNNNSNDNKTKNNDSKNSSEGNNVTPPSNAQQPDTLKPNPPQPDKSQPNGPAPNTSQPAAPPKPDNAQPNPPTPDAPPAPPNTSKPNPPPPDSISPK